jgi:predicted DNA-binding transcriptional regulator YafY
MADSAARLLHLLGLLQRRPGLSGRELAGDLGVTARTLRRDVHRLRGLGYTVEAAPGPAGGGYRLGVGASLPPLMLDDGEAMAVAVALGATASAGVAGTEGAALSALAKLDRLLPVRLRRQVTTLRDATLFLGLPRPTVPAERLASLANACHATERVRFDYQAADDTLSSRRAEPYRLVATDRRWYLVAYDLERTGWRTFRVDRITHLQRTGHTFIPRELADPARLVAQAVTSAPYRHQVVVKVAVPAGEVSARVPAGAAIVEADGEHSILAFGADDLDWTAGFLVDLGYAFEVKSPAELREHLLAIGQRLIQANRGDRRPLDGRSPPAQPKRTAAHDGAQIIRS